MAVLTLAVGSRTGRSRGSRRDPAALRSLDELTELDTKHRFGALSNNCLDPVVVRISPFCPVILRLFRGIRDSGDSLHILQAELYWHKQTERCAVAHRQGVSV